MRSFIESYLFYTLTNNFFIFTIIFRHMKQPILIEQEDKDKKEIQKEKITVRLIKTFLCQFFW